MTVLMNKKYINTNLSFLWLSVREKNDINIGQNLKLPDVGSLIFYSSDPKTLMVKNPTFQTSVFFKYMIELFI